MIRQIRQRDPAMKKTVNYFDSIAEDYNSWLNPFDLAARQAWFAKQLDLFKLHGEVALDVGCGVGHFSKLVMERGGTPVPLDIAGKLLSKVKCEMSNCIQGNSLKLPFRDNSFSLVISSECIEHTLEPSKAIREMVRVLRRGGVLVLSTPNHAWRWSIYIAETLGFRKFAGIENWLTRRQVRKVLTEFGTEIVVDEGLHLFPFQLRFLWHLLARFNRLGQSLRHWMINQCWVARKL